jgi:hypothetical protein
LVVNKVKGKLTLDTLAGSNLVFPLRGHDFSVDAGDVDTGKQTGSVVSFDNVTAVDLAGTHTTVVGTLSARVTSLRPTIWPAVRTEKSVFLLQAEPKVLIGISLHQLRGFITIIELIGRSVRVPSLAENKDVIAKTEGVREHGDRTDVDIGVFTGCLARR